MAVNLPDVHAQALEFTSRYVAAVTGDQWGRDSVCDGWTVRELVNHVVSGNFWVPELTGGKTIEEVGDRLDGDVLGDDPAAAYDVSATVAAAAFAAPGAMDRPAAVSYGPVPGLGVLRAPASSTCSSTAGTSRSRRPRTRTCRSTSWRRAGRSSSPSSTSSRAAAPSARTCRCRPTPTSRPLLAVLGRKRADLGQGCEVGANR